MNSDHGQYQDNQYEHFDDVHEDFTNHDEGEHFADEEFVNEDVGEHFTDEEFVNEDDGEHFTDEEFVNEHEEFVNEHEEFGDKKKKSKSKSKSKSSKMCRVVNYSVNLFGFRVNVWALLLVIIVMCGALFYLQYKRLPRMSDLSSSQTGGFSSTSSMNTVHNQMGGFASSPSLSVTPSFIRNLKY